MENSLIQLNSNERMTYWIEQVSKCRNSGLSRNEWCRMNNIPPSTYSYWQKKVYEYTIGQDSGNSRFVEVPVTSSSIVVHSGDITVELSDISCIRAVVEALRC